MNEPHDPDGSSDPPAAFAHSLGAAEARRTTDQVPGAAGTVASRPAVPPTATERYTLGDEIARGGMGVVHRATDNTLGREVAVKVLREQYGPQSGVARRFADEARITSQLQHPSIPPVHDLGALADGRPFLAMKLIKGQTLDELLQGRSEPGAERGRFVAVFEQVCQALAYAHAHQVIHRDLKPANVMVGAFGEVQVMDWGLAKVLPKEEGGRRKEEKDPYETIPYSSSLLPPSSLSAETQAGSVLGTPAYMPPEQAIGAVDQIDARSDVFGLGGVLCAILTGRPPFAGDTAEGSRQAAAQGKVADAFARLDACGGEPDLVALCKACLAPEKNERPGDAGVVARAVARLRVAAEVRARRAELERVRAEGEKALAREAEQRKRRKVQLALAAALVALLVGGGAVAWWRNEQVQLVRQREGRNAEAVAALLDQSEEALVAGDAAKAAVALDAARKRSAEGGAKQQADRLGRLDADLALLRDLDAVDQFRWTVAENQFPAAAVVATRTRAALARFGADPDAVSVDEAAARASASVVRERIVAALDRLLRQEKTAGVRALLRRVDADPYRDAVRDAVLADDRAKFMELAGQKATLEQSPGFAAFLGESGEIGVERRLQLLEAAVSQRSGDLGLLMTPGLTYPINQKEGADERLRWYQAAVAAAPANASAHNALGAALYDKGQLDEAIACYQKAIALEPKFAGAHNNLGAALGDKGQCDEAIACFKRAIELDPKYVVARTNLAEAERLAVSRDKFAAFQNGSYTPANNAERLGLAAWCQIKKLHHTVAGLYAAAFAADPKLADDLKAAYRYNAACYAALAAAGQGEDAAKLDDQERTRLRKQALDWLKADLALRTKQLETGQPADRAAAKETLLHWQQDSDLAGIRDAAALAKLPPEEQKACAQLWADVAELLKKEGTPATAESKQ